MCARALGVFVIPSCQDGPASLVITGPNRIVLFVYVL